MKVEVGDLEANGLLDTVTTMHCAVFKDIKTGEVQKFWPNGEDFVRKFLDHLDTVDVWIGHNIIGYDIPLLKKLFDYEFKGKTVDTLIMSRLLDPKRMVPFNCPNKKATPHSLESWGYRVGRGKPEHNDWEKFSQEMLHRCSEDTEINHLVYNTLMEEAKGKGWRDAFIMSFELFYWLQKQEEYGWLVDRPHMERRIKRLTDYIEAIDRFISPQLPKVLEIEEGKKDGEYNYVRKPFLKSGKYSQSVIDWMARSGYDPSVISVSGCFSRISYRPLDLDSNMEIKDYLLELGWEPKEWNTNDDGERTSPKMSKDDNFEGIEGKLGKRVVRRVQCRQRRGILEGLLACIRADGRIPSVVASVAVTGRATHRNIVNIPSGKSFYGKTFRRSFVARAGWVLVGCDSDQNQIRQLAARMGDEQYTFAILHGRKEDGTDQHTLNMRAAGLPNRDAAKTFFYGFLFGAGDAKVGKIVKGTAQDGKRLKAEFLAKLPALKALLDRLVEEWRKTAKKRFNAQYNRMEYYDGIITGLDGRPIKVPSEHQVLVYLLQSDEAIHMSMAYIRANRLLAEKYRYGIDYGFVAWYHDEYTVECKAEIAEDVKRICEESIAWAGEYYKISVPHIGDGKIGKNWYEIH